MFKKKKIVLTKIYYKEKLVWPHIVLSNIVILFVDVKPAL